MVRYRRHPALVIWWDGEQPVFHNYLKKRSLRSEPETFGFLQFFHDWRSREEVEAAFPQWDPRVVAGAAARLHAAGLLEAEGDVPHPDAAVLEWEWTVPVRAFHATVRNLDYATSFDAQLELYRQRLERASQPPLFKNLEAPRIPLPRVLPANGATLDEALLARKTCRAWLRQPISREQLARLLYMTWGVTGCHVDVATGPLLHKTSPSGGSRHPTEVYPVCLNVEGVPPGIYHYSVEHHALEAVRAGHFGSLMSWICAGQDWLRDAAAIFVMTSRIERIMWKYDTDRAYRVLTLDLAHLAQTFCLLATAMGLGPFITGAFRDREMERELAVDGGREPAMYLCAAGVPDPEAYSSLRLCVERADDGTLRLDDPLWQPPPDDGKGHKML